MGARPGEDRESPLPRRLLHGGWQFAKMRQVAERQGWTRFIMPAQVNLIYREEEREMLPLRDRGGCDPLEPPSRADRPGDPDPPVGE